MIKLFHRAPRRTLRKLAERKHPVARIVQDIRNAKLDLPMWLPDALELYAKGKLQELIDIGGPNRCFSMPRTMRQQAHGDQPPTLSIEVRALVAKAQNAGAKL